jgi:hypothetical protein
MPERNPERDPARSGSPSAESRGASGGFGRWKPTIYWYTPILLLLTGLGVLGLLFIIVRRFARDAEEKAWGEGVRLREHRDPQPGMEAPREDRELE